jgi:hypothetical protein
MCKVSVAKPESTPTNKKKEYDVPSSGFERRKHLIELGLLALSVIYGCVYYMNPDIQPSPEFCPEDEPECRRPDLIAYKVTSLLSMMTMGLMGVYHWHFTQPLQDLAGNAAAANNKKSSSAGPEDRLFGYLPASEFQNVVLFCYQVWDLGVSWTIPEHLDPIFLVHHVLAALTAYCSLEYQMVPYYSIFYGGCSEFSSIFLIFVDAEQQFLVASSSSSVTLGSSLDPFLLLCKVMFFLTFSYYRIFGWIYYSVPLWRDCRTVIQSGSAEQHRPGKTYFLYLFLALNVLLGGLQCYWYYKILATAVAMFTE